MHAFYNLLFVPMELLGPCGIFMAENTQGLFSGFHQTSFPNEQKNWSRDLFPSQAANALG